jgi:hypothetical protein
MICVNFFAQIKVCLLGGLTVWPTDGRRRYCRGCLPSGLLAGNCRIRRIQYNLAL